MMTVLQRRLISYCDNCNDRKLTLITEQLLYIVIYSTSIEGFAFKVQFIWLKLATAFDEATEVCVILGIGEKENKNRTSSREKIVRECKNSLKN